MVLLLSACATYQPRPLPEKTDLATDITALKVTADALPLRRLKQRPLDVSNGLDKMEVAMLAVTNNPTLKAARECHHVAEAQVYAAGLSRQPGSRFVAHAVRRPPVKRLMPSLDVVAGKVVSQSEAFALVMLS